MRKTKDAEYFFQKALPYQLKFVLLQSFKTQTKFTFF